MGTQGPLCPPLKAGVSHSGVYDNTANNSLLKHALELAIAFLVRQHISLWFLTKNIELLLSKFRSETRQFIRLQ